MKVFPITAVVMGTSVGVLFSETINVSLADSCTAKYPDLVYFSAVMGYLAAVLSFSCGLYGIYFCRSPKDRRRAENCMASIGCLGCFFTPNAVIVHGILTKNCSASPLFYTHLASTIFCGFLFILIPFTIVEWLTPSKRTIPTSAISPEVVDEQQFSSDICNQENLGNFVIEDA